MEKRTIWQTIKEFFAKVAKQLFRAEVFAELTKSIVLIIISSKIQRSIQAKATTRALLLARVVP